MNLLCEVIRVTRRTPVPLRRGNPLWLTMTALLMGMNILLSMSVFSVPVPGGHLYFCDLVINVAAVFLDPLAAFLVGGVGSFLGDFFFYPAPMFVSLFAHGLQAVAVSLISRRVLPDKRVLASSLGVAVGAVIMVIGYTIGRSYVYATPAVAMTKLPWEVAQAGVNGVLAIVLLYPMGLEKRFNQIVHTTHL